MFDGSPPYDSNSATRSRAIVLSEYFRSTFCLNQNKLCLWWRTQRALTRKSSSTYNHFASYDSKSLCFAQASLECGQVYKTDESRTLSDHYAPQLPQTKARAINIKPEMRPTRKGNKRRARHLARPSISHIAGRLPLTLPTVADGAAEGQTS